MPAGCRSIAEISTNARLKVYPSLTVLQVANDTIFRESGWEEAKRSFSVPKKGEGKNPERSLLSSMHRAKAAVRDIALCNHFEYFFTGTLSPEKVDRYDSEEVYKKVSSFLKNASYRKGFQYVIVPELHTDGAIHFHGMCNLGTLSIQRAVSPKGTQLTTERGQPIFNLLDWKLGFSECVRIDENYARTCNYLTKYITKDCKKIFGKWYLSSRNLQKKPEKILLDCMDYDAFLVENDDAPIIPIYRDVYIAQKELKEV